MEYGLFCLLVVVPAPILEFQFESSLSLEFINHTFVGFLFIIYQHILPLLFLIFVACSFSLSLSLIYTFISTFSRVSFFSTLNLACDYHTWYSITFNNAMCVIHNEAYFGFLILEWWSEVLELVVSIEMFAFYCMAH